MNAEDRAHALELASSLLDELELGEAPLDRIVLRSARLARLINDADVEQWLRWERQNFPDGEESARWRYATNRVFVNAEDNHYLGAVQTLAMVDVLKVELSQIQIPALSGDMLLPVTNSIMGRIGRTRNNIIQHQAVLAAVRGQVHDFVVRTYYALRLSTRQDGMFETAKAEIDTLISELGEDALRKIDSAYTNLNEGDSEAISAAMNSVRRLIDEFADKVFPAVDEPRRDGQGNEIKLGQQNRLNRIKAFVDDNAAGSTSRASRLKRAVSDIYDRVSTGVHNEVTATEARYLFLATYTLLGEILELPGRTAEATTDVTVGA